MKKALRLLLSVFLSLIIFSIGSSVFADTAVNLIVTNDMHGVLEESDTCIGISQVSAMKNSTENALLIDSGDATQGTTLATINKGNDIIKLMNAAGYDCMVAGNHEFDYGSDQLLKNAQTANFPILSANAVTANGTLLPATYIKTIAGKRIGFIGITTSITNTATNPNLRPGVTFANEISTAKSAIASLSGQVDTIVLLTHLGDNSSVVPVTSTQLLDGLSQNELAQVSAVLDGHSHTIESEPYTRGGLSIPVIQDQTQLSHVGKVSLTFSDSGGVSATEQVMDYETANKYPVNSNGEEAKTNTQNAIKSVKAEQETITSRVVGSTQTPLWGGYIYWDYAEPRIVETNFGDLVSDAFRNAAQTYVNGTGTNSEVLGIVNGGGIGNTINPGSITYGNVLNAFNHGNMMVVIQTTPSELYKVLEGGLRTTGQNSNGMLERESVSGSFIQCSGFTYSYNPAAEDGSKVTSVVTAKGTSLNRNDTTTPIIIGTQNYVQSFFGSQTQLTSLGGEDTVISDYITSQGNSLNYPTNGNRIKITNDKSPDTYNVTIPVYTDSNNTPIAPYTNLHLSIDNGAARTVQVNGESNLTVSLNKGPHTLELEEATTPVYVNNYSGSGIEYTKAGYYSLSFNTATTENIPATDLTLSTDSIDLATQFGSNTQTVTATVTPANSTDTINWSSSADTIATVQPNGTSAVISAVSEGRAVITVSCGSISKELTVIVSNNPIVASDYYVTDSTPDSFTVVAEDVHANRAISSGVNVAQVEMFTWSDSLQIDMDCKVVEPVAGTNDYSFTFPINGNSDHTYYLNANKIYVHIYASSQAGENGSMIGSFNYNYGNSIPSSSAVTAYCANLGFIAPTFDNNEMAGAPGLSQPLEGIRVGTSYSDVELVYSVHVAGIGWLPSVSTGEYAGTMHMNRSIEAVRMDLVGPGADKYNLTYQTIAMDNSSSGLCRPAQVAGTTGRNLPLKGIQVNITQK